ncbi:hypothetical protein EK21DRAFT_114015 [Setomelanomma holmii]|uniref:Uncharacterized protein n=1 Tax=Setomelanomma holmii TaxID=210430 RepID=A0A9P4H514_9PLEO|nr:hypothetical protein EK21DRAFT_114015 [Setomelanomma holmii]
MGSKSTHFEFIISYPVSNLKPGKSLQIRRWCTGTGMQGKNKREGSRITQREKKKAMKETLLSAAPHHTWNSSNTPSPRPLINDFVPVRFAGRGIDAEAKALLFNAFAYNIADQNMTPLDRCVNLDCLESASFQWLFTDTTFLHSILCASYATNDFMAPQWDGNPGRKTVFHLRETLSLLCIKMQNDIDLAWSLSSGPYFNGPAASWDSIIPIPYSTLLFNLYHPPSAWDFRLANVFRDFQYLTVIINRNKLKHTLQNPACFQGDLTSVQLRLMRLGDVLSTSIEKLVRLTMLAMLSTTFHIPGRRVPYDWVIGQLREMYVAARSELSRGTSLALWVLVTAAFTVAGTTSSGSRTLGHV